MLCPGSEEGLLVKQGPCAVMKDGHRGRGCTGGLTACLHSNLEAGFKKTKQEKIPFPEASQPRETFIVSHVRAAGKSSSCW